MSLTHHPGRPLAACAAAAALATRPPSSRIPPHISGAEGPPDVHAGQWETSLMMHTHPELVREDVRARLAPSGLGPTELATWRQGFEHARRVTPDGYFGAPAAAGADEGRRLQAAAAAHAADAIALRLRSTASSHPHEGRRNHG